MITKEHPSFPTLPIIVAQSTASSDKPKPGNFYVVPNPTNLSWVALKAYGNGTLKFIKLINLSEYNMQNCVYRRESANCYSPKVSSALAPSNVEFKPGAWLSLCNVDKNGIDGQGFGSALGTQYQVIWIPPPDGREPWELAPPIVDTKPPTTKLPGVKLPDISGGEPVVIPVPGTDLKVEIGKGGTVSLPGITFGGGEGTGGGEEDDQPETQPQKAGMPWWVGAILGLGAITTVIYFAVKDPKKRGKKRK
jgi:hypothetical protein